MSVGSSRIVTLSLKLILTLIPVVRANLLLSLLSLPTLVLLNAPLPCLAALEILPARFGVCLEAQCLRELALLLKPGEFSCSDLGLLVVLDQVATVCCC